MESDKRNADKDREVIAANIDNAGESTGLYKVWSHYLERAVSAEQRVAELEKALEEIKDEEWRLAGEFTTIYTAAYLALKGAEDK